MECNESRAQKVEGVQKTGMASNQPVILAEM